jgi:hypothetical protein
MRDIRSCFIFWGIVLLIFNGINTLEGGNVTNLFETIPRQIKEWKAKSNDEFYDQETLFKHINGGAELYLAYDFQRAGVRRYSGPGDNEIVMDIYDMGSSKEAFGVFTSEREEEEIGIGQGSEYGAGLLRFWKDRFFISILAVGDDATAENAILELGRAVARSIKTRGDFPGLLDYMPQNGLNKSKIRYFHTYWLLNKHYYLADKNILSLSRNTDCLLSEYSEKGHNSIYLLLIRYRNTQESQQAYQNFLKLYLPEADDSGCLKTENQKWTKIVQKQEMIAICFDAPTKSRAIKLLSSINYK